MGHPGAIHLRAYLIPYYDVMMDNVLKVAHNCRLCRPPGKLNHTTTPWQCISTGFVGPKDSVTAISYVLNVMCI